MRDLKLSAPLLIPYVSCLFLSLSLFKLWVFPVDDVKFSLPAHNLAIGRTFFYRCSYFHKLLICYLRICDARFEIFYLASLVNYLYYVLLFVSETYSSFCQIIGRHFHFHFIAR